MVTSRFEVRTKIWEPHFSNSKFRPYGKFHTFFEAFPIFRYNNQYKVLTINLFLKFQKFLGIKDDSEEEKDGGTEWMMEDGVKK